MIRTLSTEELDLISGGDGSVPATAPTCTYSGDTMTCTCPSGTTMVAQRINGGAQMVCVATR